MTATTARPKLLATPLTVANALAYLGERTERKVATATVLHRIGNDLAIRYHATDVVTLHADGSYTLKTGGYYTQTTKRRIEEYAPVRCYASGGLLWIGRQSPLFDFTARTSVLLTEGLRLAPNGKPLNAVDAEPILAAKRKLDREIAKYVKGYIAAAVQARKLDLPSGGDCWGCAMREAAGKETTAEPMGVDHYRDHFAEGYYVPSLAYNALQEYAPGNPNTWAFIQMDLRQGREPWMLRRALTRFFQRRKPALLGLIDRVPPMGTRSWQSGG